MPYLKFLLAKMLEQESLIKSIVISTYLNQLIYVTFRSSEVGRVLHIDLHVEVQVVPHVVFTFYVIFKVYSLVVKAGTCQSCKYQYNYILVI